MRRTPLVYFLMFFAIIGLAGCELVGDVLEFGFWVGLVVVGVIALAMWSVGRAVKRRTRA